MEKSPGQQAEQVSRKLAEASLLTGVAIGMDIENSSLKKDAWQRSAERWREISEAATQLHKICQNKAKQK